LKEKIPNHRGNWTAVRLP